MLYNDNEYFYTCKKITINDSANNFELIIASTLPENPIPNSFALIQEGSIWKLYFYNFRSTCFEYDLSSEIGPISDFLEHFTEITKKKALNNLSENEMKQIHKISKDYIPKFRLNTGFQVAMGNFNLGKELLYSDYFSPCIAVLARLKDGEYAIYHSHYVLGNPTDNFVKMIKDDAIEVLIFQKKLNALNNKNSTLLAVYMAGKLPDIPVKTIEIDSYTCIVLNNNKIILGENAINFHSDNKELISTSELTPHNLNNSKSIEENIKILFKNKKFVYEVIDEKYVEFSIPRLKIPKKLIESTAKSILDAQKQDLSKNKYQFYSKKKKKQTLVETMKIIINEDNSCETENDKLSRTTHNKGICTIL